MLDCGSLSTLPVQRGVDVPSACPVCIALGAASANFTHERLAAKQLRQLEAGDPRTAAPTRAECGQNAIALQALHESLAFSPDDSMWHLRRVCQDGHIEVERGAAAVGVMPVQPCPLSGAAPQDVAAVWLGDKLLSVCSMLPRKHSAAGHDGGSPKLRARGCAAAAAAQPMLLALPVHTPFPAPCLHLPAPLRPPSPRHGFAVMRQHMCVTPCLDGDQVGLGFDRRP